MAEGLETTFRVLAKTDNESAVRVLISALDSPGATIREGALIAILTRRSVSGGQELLRRLDAMPQRWRDIIREQPNRMTATLRDTIVGDDLQMSLKACRAAVVFGDYDLVPSLLTVMEEDTGEKGQAAAKAMLEMIGHLYEELAGSREHGRRRDPQSVRQYTVSSLEGSVKRFGRHQRREVIEAFLLLVAHDNVTLKQVLQNPHHVAFLATMDVLSKNESGGVVRLLLGSLSDPHVPSAGLSVISGRSDPKFVNHLLRKVGHEPSEAVAQNLKRITSIAWLRDGTGFLQQLDDEAQHGAVQLVMNSGLPRAQVFEVVKYLLLHGKPPGRRAAGKALAAFAGTEANVLALTSLDDPDPQVQAAVAVQLRRRGIPGVLPRLVELVDSPHQIVRDAARECLEEFSFKRFVGAFDILEDEVRQTTAMLVKKIDPRVVPLLQEELRSAVRSRRMRGLAMAQAIDLVEQVEETIIEMLADGDHLVRSEAATVLRLCASEASRLALRHATEDSSHAVREAAVNSLQTRDAIIENRNEPANS